MDFYNILTLIFSFIVCTALVFPWFFVSGMFFKEGIHRFRVGEIDSEIYAERMKNQDQVITGNALENFVHFLGTIFVVLGFTIGTFLQFEATYVFVAPLDKSFPAIALLFVGYAGISASKTSLLSRKSVYCRVKKKRND